MGYSDPNRAEQMGGEELILEGFKLQASSPNRSELKSKDRITHSTPLWISTVPESQNTLDAVRFVVGPICALVAPRVADRRG